MRAALYWRSASSSKSLIRHICSKSASREASASADTGAGCTSTGAAVDLVGVRVEGIGSSAFEVVGVGALYVGDRGDDHLQVLPERALGLHGLAPTDGVDDQDVLLD